MKEIILIGAFREIVSGSGSGSGYLIGAVIALLILGYLLYSLIKPEKF